MTWRTRARTATRLASSQAGNSRACSLEIRRTHWRECKPKSTAPIGERTRVRAIGPAKRSPRFSTSTSRTKCKKNAAKACLRLGLPQRLSKCCKNRAQQPEAVTVTWSLLATAWKERRFKMNWISDLPQSLSITAAQLRQDCCMSTCRSAVPLRKGGLLASPPSRRALPLCAAR